MSAEDDEREAQIILRARIAAEPRPVVAVGPPRTGVSVTATGGRLRKPRVEIDYRTVLSVEWGSTTFVALSPGQRFLRCYWPWAMRAAGEAITSVDVRADEVIRLEYVQPLLGIQTGTWRVRA